MLFLLYFVILSGYIFSKGFFSFPGILIIFFSIIIFPFIVLLKKIQNVKEILNQRTLLFLLSLLMIILYGGLYQRNTVLVLLSYGLLGLNFLITLKLVLSRDGQSQKKLYLFLLITAILLRLFMIWSSPEPYIDVYDYLKYGVLGFLAGKNPYSLTYTKLYTNFTPDYYGYLPGMLFMTLPFVAILKEPRYTFALAEIIAALLLLRINKNKSNRYVSSLLLLNNPISLYLVEQSYTEPLIMLLVVLSVWGIVSKKNWFSAIILGLALATKQYVFLFLPLMLRLLNNMREIIKVTVISLMTALSITLPFFLWNRADFIHDVITLQYYFSPRYEGLSFFSLLFRLGTRYNFLLGNIIIFSFFVFIYSRKIINVSNFFSLSSFMLLVFFFFNKWAFINYYYLISQLLLVGAVLDDNCL